MLKVLTRSTDKLSKLAKIYVQSGFTRIPDDETFIKEPNRSIINGIMSMIWTELETEARVRGSPSTKGTREPVIGNIVGSDYRALMEEYKRSTPFGKKKAAPAKKTAPSKKAVSASQKKARNNAKKAMNIMWKEGITLKQAWKKVKSGL